MKCDEKQTDLQRIEEYLRDLIALHGEKVVADRLGVNISKISRVKNGNEGFTIAQWQQVLDMGNMIICPRDERQRLIDWSKTTFAIFSR